MAIDNAKNFAKVTLSTGYASGITTVVLSAGNGALLPTVPFNAVWWDSTLATDPADDPNVEVVRVTNISTDTLTITRAQEGTAATNKNTAGHIYKMIAGLTAKFVNTDILQQAATSITLVNGLNSNINLATVPVGAGGLMRIRITGPSAAYSLGGFTNGADGIRLIVINDSVGFPTTVINIDGSSTGANRIVTQTGANISVGVANGSCLEFVYDQTNWILLNTPVYAGFTTVTLVNGANQNINLANVPIGIGGILRCIIAGPSGSFSIGGFTNGIDGLILELWNATGQTMTINHADAGSSVGNRCNTNAGANVAIGTSHGGFASFIYNTANGQWVLKSSQGA